MARRKKSRTGERAPGLSLSDRIAALNVSETRKAAYRLILERDALSAGGFVNTTGFTWRERLSVVSLPILFAGWIGYFIYGVWRKGLTLAALWAAYVLAVWKLNGEIGLLYLYLPNIIFAFMAVGDTYRQRVLQEKFWL